MQIETTQKQRIEYTKNNLKNAYHQLTQTGLCKEEIMDILLNKSTNSLPRIVIKLGEGIF